MDIGCCQGGATRGYQRAGFYVIGIDMQPQPRYVGDQFFQGNGLAAIRAIIRNGPGTPWGPIRAIATSWPCQGYTECQVIQGNEHPKLIEPGRELLEQTGLPYIQENVNSRATRAIMKNPVMLCGASFGLHTYRHRLFESNFPLTAPGHLPHTQPQVKMGRPVREGEFYQAVGNFSGVGYAARDMGVEWMTRDGIRECVPPVYTEYLGRQLMAVISGSS